MTPNEERTVEAFRQRYRYDRGLNRLMDVSEYQSRFRGFEALIAAEYARLEAESAAPAVASVAAPAAVEEPAPEPEGPRFVGKFRLVRELGRGGQGSVHLAEDTRLHRQVALKVLDASHVGFGGAMDRFRREAEVTAKLHHPGICALYEAGEDGGAPWIAMRYVEGEPLSVRIEATRASLGAVAGSVAGSVAESVAQTSVVELPQPADDVATAVTLAGAAPRSASRAPGGTRVEMRRVIRFFEKTARALNAAHEQRLIHRDIKPGNVMVTTAGEPVILDFGLARDTGGDQHTVTGTLLGTPAYMSPEQLLAQRVPLDVRTDIWSLGVTLYECITLRRPFDAPTREGLYHSILSKDPDDPRRLNPAIPRDLAIVVQTALQKDRDRRYQTALDLADDLLRILGDQPVKARPITSAERLWRWARRNPALAGSVASLFVLLTVGLAATSSLLGVARTERSRAESALGDAKSARDAERGQRERAEAQLLRARQLGLVAASSMTQPSQPVRSLLLARAAARLLPSAVAASRLHSAIQTSRERGAVVGHSDLVISVEFSPDGTRLLTASFDGTARIWDLDGKPLSTLSVPDEKFLTAATFSADGSRVLTAGDHGAHLWDRSGKQLATIPANDWTSTALSPDGTRVALGHQDGTAQICDDAGREVAALRGHAAMVWRVAFSPDGSRILTVSEDKTARLWSLAGKELVLLRGCADGLGFAAEFSPDGTRVVAVCNDKTARIWDLSGNELAALRGHEEAVRFAGFSPDGTKVLTTSDDKTVRLWDLSGNELAVFRGHDAPVNSAKFSRDGSRVVTASQDGTVRIWDLAGQQLAVVGAYDAMVGGASSAMFTPDGARIVTVGGLMDTSLRIFDPFVAELATFPVHDEATWAVAVSADGTRLLTTSSDKTARLLDVSGRTLAVLRGHEARVVWGGFSPDGTRLLTTSDDGTARLWSLDGKETAVLRGHETALSRAEFSSDGTRVLTLGLGGDARLWDLSGRQLTVFPAQGRGLTRATMFPDGARVLTAGYDGKARIWDMTGKELLVLSGHDGCVQNAGISPDGTRVSTAGQDNTARIWDAVTGKELFVLRGHTGAVVAASFSPNSKLLVTPSDDRSCRLWDVATGRELAVMRGHAASFTRIMFSPDSTCVATSNMDGSARLWNLKGEEVAVLRGHTDGVTWIQFSPDGSRVYTASCDHTIRVWCANFDSLLRLADDRALRDFTDEEKATYADLLGIESPATDEAAGPK